MAQMRQIETGTVDQITELTDEAARVKVDPVGVLKMADTHSLRSIAISLKRIADAMETARIPDVEVFTGLDLDGLARMISRHGPIFRRPGETDADFCERIKAGRL